MSILLDSDGALGSQEDIWAHVEAAMSGLSEGTMKELSEALETASADPYGDNGLNTAAERWVIFAMRTFKGKRLRRALAVSAAILQFTAVCEAQDPPEGRAS